MLICLQHLTKYMMINSDRKKILFIANLNPNKFGSIEEHALFLSRELRRRGHQCYLGFISDPAPDIRRLFEEAGAKVVTVYCGNTPLVGNKASLKFMEMLALRRMVIQNGIDLVHINFMGVTNPSLLGVYLTRARIVFTEHASGSAPQRSPLKHFFSWCIHGVISRRISKYIAVSEFVRNRLKVTHHLPDEKTVTIYNGVNLERFCPRERDEARKELGLSPDIPIVCTVAMLIPEKGIQHLIEAISILVKDQKLPGLLALIVGEGWYSSHLEMLSETLGVSSNVRFLGRRSDVPMIIAASDAVVVPSVWEEAFGLIVTESMASNRPVIATNVGGIPELIDAGVNGCLVESGNDVDMAESINDIIFNHEKKAQYGGSGCLKVIKQFNLPLQVVMLADLYETMLG